MHSHLEYTHTTLGGANFQAEGWWDLGVYLHPLWAVTQEVFDPSRMFPGLTSHPNPIGQFECRPANLSPVSSVVKFDRELAILCCGYHGCFATVCQMTWMAGSCFWIAVTSPGLQPRAWPGTLDVVCCSADALMMLVTSSRILSWQNL